MTGFVSSQEIFSLKKSYDSQVFIEGTDQVSIKEGMQLALSSLLVTISGDSQVIKGKSISKMLQTPEKYINQYKLGTEDEKIYASFIFEGDLIRSYLSENELPLWLSNDNLILSYLPCKEESNGIKSKEEYEKCNNLEKILTPLSNKRNSKIVNEKSIRVMMDAPEKYITQYKLGTEDKKIYASFIFEGDLIRSYLSENELPLWLSNDNLILSYLPCKEESDTIKSEEENEKCNKLEETLNDLSSRRNSIIANPLMDLKDINYFESLGSISTERFMKRISRRYEVGSWLLCLIKDEFGLLLDNPKCFSSLGKQSSPSEALNDLLDKVNSKKSLIVDKNIKNKTSIRVIGITNLANLENVLNDLKSQVLVYGVTLKKVEGDTLDILLSHFGKSEDLKNLLNINDDFKGIDNSSVKVDSYKYNNS